MAMAQSSRAAVDEVTSAIHGRTAWLPWAVDPSASRTRVSLIASGTPVRVAVSSGNGTSGPARATFWVVGQATAELTDAAETGLTRQRRGNRWAGGEVQEVARREDPTPPMASDTVKYRLFSRLRVLGHRVLKQKLPQICFKSKPSA